MVSSPDACERKVFGASARVSERAFWLGLRDRFETPRIGPAVLGRWSDRRCQARRSGGGAFAGGRGIGVFVEGRGRLDPRGYGPPVASTPQLSEEVEPDLFHARRRVFFCGAPTHRVSDLRRTGLLTAQRAGRGRERAGRRLAM